MPKITGEAIGVDVGGLRLKAVRIHRNEDGTIVRRSEHVETLRPEDRAPDAMQEKLTALFWSLGAKTPLPCGLAIPGGVRQPDGVVTQAPNFPDWREFDIRARLEAELGVPVAVDNDANMHTYAEWVAGAGRDTESLLGVFLGTGVGGGLILDGQLYRGRRGIAGEVGHVVLHPAGEPCGCGARGCLEQYASTLFLLREARRLDHPAVQNSEPAECGRRLAVAARGGDGDAMQLFHALGTNLGTGLAGILNVLDVEALVIGGGLVQAWDLFADALEQTLRARLYDAIAADLGLLRAECGDSAAAVGAACFALDSSRD